MGLFDFIEDIDVSEDHLWGHGFDSDTCYGDGNGYTSKCPHLKEGGVDSCGCCGCPIFNLDKADAPPESCPRLDGHEA
jgi:hypothetical protein